MLEDGLLACRVGDEAVAAGARRVQRITADVLFVSLHLLQAQAVEAAHA